METVTTKTPVVLSAEALASIPATPFGPIEGVSHKLLWTDDVSMAGILEIAPGHRLGKHAHRANHHHIWILEGRAAILGEPLGAGSYVHIPSGVEHDIDATATDGCTVYYLYLRPGD